MVRNKLLFALLLLAAQTLPVASARPTDQSYFTAWMLQVYRASAEYHLDRLPCRTSIASCGGLTKKAKLRKRGGKVDPFTQRKLKAKNVKRVQAGRHKGSVAESGAQVFAMPAGFLVLSDAGRDLLGVDVDNPGATPPRVDALAGYVDQLHRPVPRSAADATGGVGDSAYGALYDFDDEGGGETQRGFVEIPSLLSVPAAAVAAIPEPGTLLLCGAGLLGWYARRRGPRLASAAPRIA